MNRRLAFAAAAALAIALAACGGGGGGGGAVPVTQPPVSSNSNVPPQLLVQNYGQSAMSGATYVGPVTNAHMSVSVLVHQQNAQGLLAYAQAVQNPGSSSFRHFLTPDQIAAQFGASQTDYQNTAQYFVNNGLAVAGWKQRMLLSVSGPQANVEKAFGTTFGIYQRNGQQFIAPNSQPHFLQQLAVDAVGGIVKYRADHTYIIMPPKAGSGLTVGFSPSTVRAAFDYVGAYSAGYDGAGINLGIIGTGPINTTTSGHGDVDLNAYLAATNTSAAAPVTEVQVSPVPIATGLSKSGCTAASGCTFPYSGSFQSPPPVTPPCASSLPNCNPEDGEAQLDTQQASTLAPGSNVLFYLAYNAADCTTASFPSPCASNAPDYGPEIGLIESDPEIMQAIADNAADVLSLSYGGGEPQQGWSGYSGPGGYEGSYSQLEFAALAIEGIAVFVSSGDNGSAECFSATTYLGQVCDSYPAGDPSVTSVGGITANVNVYGQQTAPWLAWGISTFDTGYGATEGSGGGASATGGVGIPAPAVASCGAGRDVSRAARRFDDRRSKYRRVDGQQCGGRMRRTNLRHRRNVGCGARDGRNVGRRIERMQGPFDGRVRRRFRRNTLASRQRGTVSVCDIQGYAIHIQQRLDAVARIQPSFLRHRVRRQPDGEPDVHAGVTGSGRLGRPGLRYGHRRRRSVRGASDPSNHRPARSLSLVGLLPTRGGALLGFDGVSKTWAFRSARA